MVEGETWWTMEHGWQRVEHGEGWGMVEDGWSMVEGRA